jgi:hypothetical protein
MRARLHVTAPDGGGETDGTPSPITLQPSALVTDAPPVPHPDDTEDALRSDPDATYTPERHHERHTAALDRGGPPRAIESSTRSAPTTGTADTLSK